MYLSASGQLGGAETSLLEIATSFVAPLRKRPELALLFRALEADAA